jgi:hypothetical protein
MQTSHPPELLGAGSPRDAIPPEALWLPFARAVVAGLADTPLTIVRDGTTSWARLCQC